MMEHITPLFLWANTAKFWHCDLENEFELPAQIFAHISMI
jgi:hypothetical protein